jgi:polyisoprenoid-binding protein YceI
MKSILQNITRISVLAMLATGLCLSQGHLKPVSNQSQVGFSLRHLTGRAEGHFGSFEGDLNFSPETPEKSEISFQVDVASVDTDNQKRDDHLRGEEYFHASKYPKMTFTSKQFKTTGKNRYKVTGPLTIKGHTKMVTIPITLKRKTTLWATGQESLVFGVAFEIDRTEFGVGENSSLLGSEVSIDMELEFRDAK